MDFKQFAQSYALAQRGVECKMLDVMNQLANIKKVEKHFNVCNVALKVLVRTDSYTMIKLKYTDYCKFQDVWMFAARGSMCFGNSEACYFVHAINKFFNWHELDLKCSIKPEAVIQQLHEDSFQLVCVPKWDGSNVQVFYDASGTLSVFTLSSLISANVKIGKKQSPTYHEAVSSILQTQLPLLLAYLKANPWTSLVCELITPHNVIVTSYASRDDMLIPLVLIDRSGFPSWQELATFAPNWFVNDLPLGAHEFVPNTHAEVFEAAEAEQLAKPDVFGTVPEGLVLYACKQIENRTVCLPFAKKKFEDYLVVMKGGALKGSVKEQCQLQQLVLEAKSDDVMDADQQRYMEEFKDKCATFAINHLQALLSTLQTETDHKKWHVLLREGSRTKTMTILLSSLQSLLTSKKLHLEEYDVSNKQVCTNLLFVMLHNTNKKQKQTLDQLHKEVGSLWYS
jgi:hypothetical protein